MNRLINVARYHLVDRINYAFLPCGVTAFTFLVNLAIFFIIAAPVEERRSGGLTALYVFLFVAGIISAARWLPFGLTLGLSRRTYYLGTLLLALGIGVVYSTGVTVLQAVERATGGWGLQVHFFRVPWLLNDSWYQTWVTSFVLMVLIFVHGMWFGLVYRRWNILGVVSFTAAQVVVLVGAALLITALGAWPAVGHFFLALSPLGLTTVLAVLAAALAVGGLGTMRRVTV